MLKQEPTSRGVGILGLQAGEEVKPEQKAKLTTLGGAKWVRERIDEQPE